MAAPRNSPNKSPGSHVTKDTSRIVMVVQRSKLRLVGSAVLLGALLWTFSWQVIFVPALHSSGRSTGHSNLSSLFSFLFRPVEDFEDQEDLKLIKLNRDPCPKEDLQFPTLSLVSVSLKAVAWALQANRWQEEMDACKCMPKQEVKSRHNEAQGVFDILSYGAIGDGRHDDSVALRLAFQAACTYSRRESVRGVVSIPSSCFYIKPVEFNGPCGVGITFQVDGTLLGPLEPSSYADPEYTSYFFPYTNGLLTFRNFTGLSIEGEGVVEGQGFIFWNRFRDEELGLPIRPFAIRLMSCVDTAIRGITIRNSPMYHIFAYDCQGLLVSGITTHSPGNSPNTDSIKLVGIQDCHISDCRFHGGDDDVSIVAVEGLVARNVTVQNIRATSGHGISIGSVGWNGTTACVSDILVRNVTLKQLTNGVRIKSWQGGKGIVRNVRYENIRFKDTSRAIALDQFYCDRHQNWTCARSPSNVAFYNISYSNLTGTVSTYKGNSAVQIKCSPTVPCTRINLKGIHLTESPNSRKSLTSAFVQTFDNVLESKASDLGGALAPTWKGGRRLSSEQEREIRQMAARCGFEDVTWEPDASLFHSSRVVNGDKPGDPPRRPQFLERFDKLFGRSK